MELLSCVLLLIYCISENAADVSQSERATKTGQLSYLYAIEEDLLHQTWREQEQPCLRQLLKVIKNVQNSTLWATWIWDSMQFPVGQLYGSRLHLGNYDQCLDLPWEDHPEFRTQYCLAHLVLSELDPKVTSVNLLDSTQTYLRHRTKHGLRYNYMIWGICVPAVCRAESISKFADAMFRSTHLGKIENPINITVNAASCQVAGEHDVLQAYEYFLLSSLILLFVMALFSSFYVGFKGLQSKSIVLDIARAFCIKSNVKWLTKPEDESMRSMQGIRIFLAFSIITGHMWLIKNIFGIANAKALDKRMDDFSQRFMFNIDMTVDTFFMISGILVTKTIVGTKLHTFNPITVICRRYLRLVCSIIVVIWVQRTALLYGDSGPLVKTYLHTEVDTCTDNWWRTVLMIGNYGNTENMCYTVSWSLACDFHLFLIGILIFCIYRKSRRAGIGVYIVCAGMSVILPVLYGYTNNQEAVISFDFRIADNHRKYLLGDPGYVNTHLRAGPYFVGMAIGYMMALFPPHIHRNAMSKVHSILAFIAFLVLFVSVNIICGMYHVRQYGPLEGALVAVGRRNVFAALIGFFIVICEYGTLPLLSNVFDWSGLVPLSKLSYGVYLTHILLVFRVVSRTREPHRNNVIEDIYATFGLFAATTTISFLVYLFWQAPLLNLVEMVLKSYRVSRKIQKKENAGGNDKKK